MVQTLAVTDYITSLAEAEQLLGIVASPDPDFFAEWTIDLPVLTTSEQQRLD